jgi:predicted dehydrogenase
MLDQQEPDNVVVCGPFELHAQMCIDAFERGMHVFCEKPVALNWEEFDALKAAYQNVSVHFSAMMGLRYHPAFYTAWQAVRDGAIGTVRLMDARKSYRLGERPPFYHARATYGGTIPWVGSHAIDWIYWFSGETFESVYATHSTRHNHNNGDLEMSALCYFSMSNEVLASASIDYARPANAPTHGDDRIRVAGTDGVIEVRGGQVFLINSSTDGEEIIPAQCDRQIFQDFVEGIEGRTTHVISADDIWAVTEACLLARQSADEGLIKHFRLKGRQSISGGSYERTH